MNLKTVLLMRKRRQKYQGGCLRKVPRSSGAEVWEFRYRDHNEIGSPTRQKTFSCLEYPTEKSVRLALGPTILEINGTRDFMFNNRPTMGLVARRFIKEEGIQDLLDSKPGQTVFSTTIAYSTASGYMSMIKCHILPKWDDVFLDQIRAIDISDWLNRLPLAGKSKQGIRMLLHLLYERAMLWGLIKSERNIVMQAKLRGGSKRQKRPAVLTMDECKKLLENIPEPYNTMVRVAMCTGLRVSEILGLHWHNVSFGDKLLKISQAAVAGRLGPTKTEASEDELPMSDYLISVLREHHERCPENTEGLLFPSARTGNCMHSGMIAKNYIKPAAEILGLKDVGWHTFRHSYRSMLGDTGADVGTQQNLMRHSNVSTTMNTYGKSSLSTRASANNKVVSLLFDQEPPAFPIMGIDLGIAIGKERGRKYDSYRKGAEERGLCFDLDIQDFVILTEAACHYCGRLPKAKAPDIWKSNGIDRKVNSLGYIDDNCLPCCAICNSAKGTRSYQEFVNYINDLRGMTRL